MSRQTFQQSQADEMESQASKRRRLTRKTSTPVKREGANGLKDKREKAEVSDEKGLWRAPCSGGSQAMHGVEVVEPVGAAAENLKRTAEHVYHNGVPALKPSSFKRINLAKQSGVPNIAWNSRHCAWQVKFPKADSKSLTTRQFPVKKFLSPGIREAEADAAALQAAQAFRLELVKQGVLSEPKAKDPNFTSKVPGVQWKKLQQKWAVQISQKGGKRICGGYFTDRAAAEPKALELRQQHGLERQVKAVSSLSSLPVFQPKVPYPGVKWNQPEQQWHAKCEVGGKTRNFRVKPKDHSEEELERSYKVAVAWKKKQEKEKGTAVRAKAKLGKKHRSQVKVSHPGVSWEERSHQWHAQCVVAGRNLNFYVEPKDHTEEELEHSYQVAVAWKKAQEEEEKGTATRAKAEPGKKQTK